MLRSALTSCCLLMSCVLGGCNPFMQHYSGTTYPSVRAPQVVETAPSESTLIGSSNFTTSETCTINQALDAASKVGAQYLVYTEENLGEHRSWEQTTLMTRSGAAGGTMPVNLSVPVTRQWYEYRADFYRQLKEANSATASEKKPR